jgi:SAM-dependent methyltransferase
MNIPWKIKSFTFHIIDITSSPNLLYFLQKHITKRSRNTKLDISINWVTHSETLVEHNATKLIFEFGAGKSLAQNIYLSNTIKQQIVVDLNPMIDLELVESKRQLISTQSPLPSSNTIESISDLKYYGIDYKAPFDAANTMLPDNTFEACISTNTLEHIPVESIKLIFKEIYRVLKPAGVVSAKIDYSDHYAHTDKTISLLNFLKFTDKQWKKHNHKCHYLNRLRHYDYLNIFRECGFEIVSDRPEYKGTNIPINISEIYANAPESWAATAGYIVLKKPNN